MQITNLTKLEVDKKLLLAAEKVALNVLGRGLEEISLVLVGDAKIKEVNKKYRGKNKITDVLSFEELNEIFICLPQAKRFIRQSLAERGSDGGQAKQSGKALKSLLKAELTRLLVHGIVHLKGYDHEQSAKAAREAVGIENKILARL